MFKQVSTPFALGPDGLISTESEPNRQIEQRLHTLVGTSPGERVMLPNYGVPVTNLVFEEESLVEVRLLELVRDAVAAWEPGVIVQLVKPVWDAAGDGIASVEIDFVRTEAATSPIESAKKINTAVIKIGGTVDEVIRG